MTRFEVTLLFTLVVALAGIMHYTPEPPLTSGEIALHQLARNIFHGVPVPDRLIWTRGSAQIQIVPLSSTSTAQVGVAVDWGSLAAMLAVMTALYALLTKLIIAPMLTDRMLKWMDEADKKYVHANVYEVQTKSIDRQLSEILNTINNRDQ